MKMARKSQWARVVTWGLAWGLAGLVTAGCASNDTDEAQQGTNNNGTHTADSDSSQPHSTGNTPPHSTDSAPPHGTDSVSTPPPDSSSLHPDTSPPPPFGNCELTAARVRITEIDVGMTVQNNETDGTGSVLQPIMMAAIPSGGSRVAWMGQDAQVHVATLDGDDQLTGAPIGVPARSLADIYADNAGGVVLVTRDAHGSGERHCGELNNLCGAASERDWQGQWNCWDMYLVRFDGSSETWATNLTESTPTNPPYLTSPTGSSLRFIWEPFAHHGRIASDGESYAAYFGAAVSVSQSCQSQGSVHATAVNIHQGDRMQVVDLAGDLLQRRGGFDWGCSHSGYERVVWDAATSEYVAVCKTDNNNRLARPAPYRTIRSVDLWYANMSDLVPAGDGRIWLATSDIRPGEAANASGLADIHLLAFTDGEAVQDVVLASESGVNHRAPQLAAYGAERMVVAWDAGTSPGDFDFSRGERQMHLQVVSRETGEAEGAALPVDMRGNRYHKLVGFPDGSVAYAGRGTAATQIKILRVLPCRE